MKKLAFVMELKFKSRQIYLTETNGGKIMIRNLKKRNLASMFAFIITVAIMMTPLTVHAIDFTQPGIVNGDGVRLRRTPGYDGDILELMYKGESILISDFIDNNHPAWLYVQRVKTKTKGWMEWSYFEH